MTDFQQLTQPEYFEKNPKRGALMKKKYTIKDMQEIAKKRGLEKTGVSGKCLSKIYLGTKKKHEWQCGKCGYIWKARPTDIISRGYWCRKCAGNFKYTIKYMRELAKCIGLEKTGKPGIFLSKSYLGMRIKHRWQCGKCGFVWESTPSSIKHQRNWCRKCAGRLKLTIKDMHNLARIRGIEKTEKPGKCLSKHYIGQNIHLKWQCGKCGHIWEATPSNIKYGKTWCPKCAGKLISIEDMKELAKSRGLEETGKQGKCLSNRYINTQTHLEWQCGKCRYIWKAMPCNIKSGTWCPNCSKGKMERICRGYFKQIYKAEFLTQRPKWLINYKTGNKMHLDGFNGKLKLAFECNGPQHYHFDPFFHRKYQDFVDQQERDFLKKKLCEENNVVLIIIPFIVSFDNIQDYIVKEYEDRKSVV